MLVSFNYKFQKGEIMANEIRGLLFETITDMALQQAIRIARIPGEVRWNERPEGMNITPDFTIGTDVNKPSHVVLVTASGAARNSEMKAWRNLGEMQEVKAQLLGPPIVINVYFKSEVRQGVVSTAEHLYDSILYIENKKYYKPLERWVEANLRNAAKTKEARRTLLRESVRFDKEIAAAIDELANDLAVSLKQRKVELDSLWRLMQADFKSHRNYRSAKVTTVRRGLAKLSVLEPKNRKQVYESLQTRRAMTDSLPNYVFDLDFFKKSLAGARLVDAEILNVISLLGADRCEEVLDRTSDSTSIWINQLRNLSTVSGHVDFVYENYEKFTNPKEYEKLIVECFDDPTKLSGIGTDEKVWVFEIIVTLLKAKSGRLQGYGSAQIAQDTQIPELLKGLHGIVLAPFVQCEKMFSPENLSRLATGMSKRISSDIKKDEILKLKENTIRIKIKENLEDRLIPYCMFEPLPWLLELELKKQGKSGSGKLRYGGWLNEFAEVGRSRATTPFIKVGTTLIHWKSVSDAGKDHKKKELSARARNVKYQYDAKTKTFKRREGVERLALIADGTFTDSDLKVLADSGWDLIVYPDEISDLVSKL